MSDARTLPRLGVLAALLAVLVAAAAFGAAGARAGHNPNAADIRVRMEVGTFVFPSDQEIGVIHVYVDNYDGTKNAKQVKVNIFQMSMWPASIESVAIDSNNSGSGVICTHLSNINTQCVIERLPVGTNVTFHVNLRTQNLGGALSADGLLRANASTAVGEVDTADNSAKRKYTVYEP